jgi:hypothetical protein
VYEVTIRGDGTFDYVGEAYVERQGVYSGSVNRRSFNRLVELIEEVRFMDLEDSYAVPLTDQATTYTTVVMDGETKTVSHYGGAGPAVLWAIETLIDTLVQEAAWDE